MRCVTCLFVALALLAPGLAFGHGLWIDIAPGPTTTITATYGTGEPMAGATYLVLPPSAEAPADSGVTDARGTLSFRPDRVGTWEVDLRGADGHGANVTVDVDQRTLEGPMPVQGEAHFQPEQASAANDSADTGI